MRHAAVVSPSSKLEGQLEEQRAGLSTGACAFSTAALGCAVVGAATTLVWSGAFPPVDSDAFNMLLAEARGWSAVTLVVAVPLLAAGLVTGRRGSLPGTLVAVGVLGYLLYTFLELAVSPPFTALYLVYVAGVATGVVALALSARHLDIAAAEARYGSRAPRRLLAAFNLLVAAGLSVAWLRDIVARMYAGAWGWPQGAAAVSHVVHALDLGLQVPFAATTAVVLLLRRPLGITLGALSVVNGVVMGAALTSMAVASLSMRGASIAPAAVFAILPITSLLLGGWALRPLGPVTRARSLQAR
jgi:hypothetical protein